MCAHTPTTRAGGSATAVVLDQAARQYALAGPDGSTSICCEVRGFRNRAKGARWEAVALAARPAGADDGGSSAWPAVAGAEILIDGLLGVALVKGGNHVLVVALDGLRPDPREFSTSTRADRPTDRPADRPIGRSTDRPTDAATAAAPAQRATSDGSAPLGHAHAREAPTSRSAPSCCPVPPVRVCHPGLRALLGQLGSEAGRCKYLELESLDFGDRTTLRDIWAYSMRQQGGGEL